MATMDKSSLNIPECRIPEPIEQNFKKLLEFSDVLQEVVAL